MRGVINGRIVGDINTYKGIESESSKVTVDNEKKEIKVDVKDEFIDEKLTSKQDKLIYPHLQYKFHHRHRLLLK